MVWVRVAYDEARSKPVDAAQAGVKEKIHHHNIVIDSTRFFAGGRSEEGEKEKHQGTLQSRNLQRLIIFFASPAREKAQTSSKYPQRVFLVQEYLCLIKSRILSRQKIK